MAGDAAAIAEAVAQAEAQGAVQGPPEPDPVPPSEQFGSEALENIRVTPQNRYSEDMGSPTSVGWDAGIYIDEVKEPIYNDPADAMLFERVGYEVDPFNRTNTGFNDLSRLTGVDQRAEATGLTSARQARRLYYEGGESRRAYIQDLLHRAGVVVRKNPEPQGGWGSALDTDYNKAWEDVIEVAQDTGIPIFVLLRQEAEAIRARGGIGSLGSGSGSGSSGPRRPTVQLISESDAREIVDQVAQQELGRKLTGDEEKLASSIVGAIRSRMESEQNAMIDQQMAGGGTASRPTDPSVTAKEEVTSRRESEAKAYDLVQTFADLTGIITGRG